MTQDFLKDITPPAHKRSIRDIPIPVSRKNTNGSHEVNLKKIKVTEPRKEQPVSSSHTTSASSIDQQYYKDFLSHQTAAPKKSRIVPMFFIVLLAALAFGGLHVFAYATITLHIKNATVDLNSTIQVVDIADVENENQLAYREIPFSKEVSTTIEATGEEYVSTKSSGIITVYNEYTTKPQNLLKNTRFESTSGKIYRIDKSINVPGYKTSGGKKIPGSIDVTVYADVTGESHDTGKTDFTIPGFKGQEQFKTVYAKSKTDIDGGYEGNRKIIAKEVMTATTDTLIARIKTDLITEVNNQLPSNLTPIFDDTSFVIDPIQKKDDASGKVLVSVAGKITVKVVDRNKLSEKLAEVSIPDYVAGDDVLVEDFKALTISLTDESVTVAGTAHIIWQINEDEIKKKAAGTLKNETQATFSSVTGVEKIETKFMPVWKTAFPENVDRIKITTLISDN